jgi:hypothetical protein
MHSRKKPATPMNPTEARAKEIALAYERRRISKLLGPEAIANIREIGEGGGYEIVSADGRMIEVKGTSGTRANYAFVINSAQEVNHLRNGGYIYRITDVFGTPKIHILQAQHVKLTPRYRADVRIQKGIPYDMADHEDGEL